jgi:hypothetical protein
MVMPSANLSASTAHKCLLRVPGHPLQASPGAKSLCLTDACGLIAKTVLLSLDVVDLVHFTQLLEPIAFDDHQRNPGVVDIWRLWRRDRSSTSFIPELHDAYGHARRYGTVHANTRIPPTCRGAGASANPEHCPGMEARIPVWRPSTGASSTGWGNVGIGVGHSAFTPPTDAQPMSQAAARRFGKIELAMDVLAICLLFVAPFLGWAGVTKLLLALVAFRALSRWWLVPAIAKKNRQL